MTTQLLADTYNLALPNLDSVSSIILSLLGTLFTVFMATKIFAAYARRDWGALVMEVAAGAVVAFFVFLPAAATTLLKTIGTGIFGA